MITCANSLYRERDAQPSGRCSTLHPVRYRAVPRTNRTPSTANTRSHFATSSTSGLPACAPSPPWLCFCPAASPSECTDVASLGCSAQLLGQPPPARSATRSSNDQHVGERRKWAHAGMRHQPQRLGPFPSFLLRGGG